MSPFENRAVFRPVDYIKITIFGFALTALWQSIHTIILPLRLLEFVPEAQKNTYLGWLTFSGLVLAMFMQPIAGAISDRSGFRMGRRRPFILMGGIASLLVIPGIGLAGSYAAIFAVYCVLQVTTNSAQGPFQAFIPDLAPEDRRGMASGVKALLEILGGIALVYLTSIFMDRYFAGEGGGWLWLVLGILAVILLGAVVFTTVTVKERAFAGERRKASLFVTLLRTAREIASDRDIVWFLASRLLVYMAFTTIQQFALYFLRDVIGVANPAEATARFSVIAVAGMLVAVWPAGYICDRIGRKSVTVAAGLLGALGIGVIIASQEYGTILWAAGVIGVAIGAFNSTNWALATDLVAKGEEARYLGVANMATAGGAALARGIGPAIDFFNGRSPGMGYTFMLIMCLVYFLVGSLLVLPIRRSCSVEPRQQV